MKFEHLSNTELSAVIDEWVRGERDRRLMKRRLIDCITMERLSEEFDLSVRQTYTIVQKNLSIIADKT